MKTMKKLFIIMLAFTLTLGGILSTDPQQLNIKAEEGYTDITQVKITADETIEKNKYKKAKISISDAGNESYDLAATNIKIKIRGNSTSNLDKKPYNIKFDKSTSIFGWAKGKKYCFLANRFDKSLIRNYLAFKLSSELRLAYTVSYKFVDLWLNGTYQGNYLVTTPIETGKRRLDIDTKANDVLLEREASKQEEDVTYLTSPVYNIRFAINDPETPTEEQLQSYTDVLKKAENAMRSHDYNAIESYIDVDSFTDFFILEEYLKQVDVDYSSTRYYIKDNKLYASPAWDYDLSAGNADKRYGESVSSYKGVYALTTAWMSELMKCAAFKKQFIDRFNALGSALINLYDKDIDEIVDKYKDAFSRDSAVAGWDFVALGLDRIPEDTYGGNVNFLKDWLKKRYSWLYIYFNRDHTAYDEAYSLVSALTVNDAVSHSRLDAALSADSWKDGITQDEIDAMTKELLDAGLEYSGNLTVYLTDQVKETKNTLSQSQAQLMDTKETLNAANNSLTEAQAKLEEETKANENAKTVISSLANASDQLTAAHQAKKAEVTELESKLSTANKSLAAAQKEVEKLKAGNSTAKKKAVHATGTNISAKVKKIKAKAYKNNKYLKTVTIPASVTEIGAQAFYNCKNVNKLVIKSNKLKKIGKQAFRKTGSVHYKKLTVVVPKKKRKAYKKMLLKAGLSPKATVKAS